MQGLLLARSTIDAAKTAWPEVKYKVVSHVRSQYRVFWVSLGARERGYPSGGCFTRCTGLSHRGTGFALAGPASSGYVADRSVEAVRMDHFEQFVVVAIVDMHADEHRTIAVIKGAL
jgi:hypothetical protein